MWKGSAVDRAGKNSTSLKVRTDACSGANVENAMQLLALDRRKEQLVADALGHEGMRQVKAVQLSLYERSAQCRIQQD
jgi:hypothetical protein